MGGSSSHHDKNTHDVGEKSDDNHDSTSEGISGRKPKRDLTKGSIRKNLWHLGWPQMAESFLSVVDQLADLLWAGKIGFQAMAGMGVSQAYLTTVIQARIGFDSSMRAMISRAVGARNIPYANHVLMQSLTLTTLLAIFVIVLGLLFTEFLLGLTGLSEAVVEQASGYMRLQIVALMILSFQRLTGGALQASGDSLTPLRAAFATRMFHLLLSPLLMFGWIGFPELGLSGAGLARVVAEVIGTAMNFHALSGSRTELSITLRDYRLDWPLMKNIINVGIPASITSMQAGLSQLVVVGIAVQFGEAAVAVFAFIRRADNIVNHSSRGFGRAAGALAAHNLSINLVGRAKSTFLWALVYVTGITTPIIFGFLLFPEFFLSVFNEDTAFIEIGVGWLTLAAFGYLAMSPVQVFTQGFNTSGATLVPMLITVLTTWAIEIPLSYGLAMMTPLGHLGIPCAIVIAMFIRLILFTWYYFTGKWQRTGLI